MITLPAHLQCLLLEITSSRIYQPMGNINAGYFLITSKPGKLLSKHEIMYLRFSFLPALAIAVSENQASSLLKCQMLH